jgi:glutamate/aspartate transport system substrate-binding protein
VADDVIIAGQLAKRQQTANYRTLTKPLSVEPYALMMHKSDKEFEKMVDGAILNIMKSGELEAIYSRWFDTSSIKLPMSGLMRENIKFPNKYGLPD